MSLQPISINLPAELYDRLKERAEKAHRSVEAELIEVVAIALPHAEELSPDLAAAVSALDLLDDAALKRAAQSHLSKKLAARAEVLQLKRQREGLNSEEAQTLQQLVKQYEKLMLIRSQAIKLLHDRNYDVNQFLSSK